MTFLKAEGVKIEECTCSLPKHTKGLCIANLTFGTESSFREQAAINGHRLIAPRRTYPDVIFYDHCVAECSVCDAALCLDPISNMFYGTLADSKKCSMMGVR